MRLRALCVLCLFALLVVPLTGCQAAAEKATEEAIEKSTGVEVDQDEGKVSITTKEGEKAEIQTGDDVQLPEGFPDDVPLYKGAKLTVANSYEADGKKSYSVVLETSDDVETVHAWYKEALEKDGWTIEGDVSSSASGQAMAVIGAKKGEREFNATMGSDAEGSKTTITIVVTE